MPASPVSFIDAQVKEALNHQQLLFAGTADVCPLHDNAAAARLLWRVRVLALREGAPDSWDHIVPRAITISDDAKKESAAGPLTFSDTSRMLSSYLLAAVLTGIRSRSRSSRRRLLSSVNRRSLRSAMDCFVFLICDGSTASRDVYCGMVALGSVFAGKATERINNRRRATAAVRMQRGGERQSSSQRRSYNKIISKTIFPYYPTTMLATRQSAG